MAADLTDPTPLLLQARPVSCVFSCPFCRRRHGVPAADLGRMVVCSCRTAFVPVAAISEPAEPKSRSRLRRGKGTAS